MIASRTEPAIPAMIQGGAVVATIDAGYVEATLDTDPETGDPTGY
jgi:hypothetical protein